MSSLDHNLPNNHHLLMGFSPSSSSFSCGFSSSDEGFSPSIAQMEQNTYQAPNTHYLDSRVVKNSNGYMFDELGLCENLGKMKIGEDNKDYSTFRRFGLNPDGLVGNYARFDGFSSDGFQSSITRNSMSSDDDMKAKLLGFCEEYNAGDLMRSHLTHNQFRPLYSEPPSCYKDVEYVVDQRQLQGRGSCNGGFQLQNPSINRPHLDDESNFSQRRGADFFGSKSLLNPVNSSQMVCPNLDFNMDNPVGDSSMLKEGTRAIPNGRVPPPLLSMTDSGDFEAFSYEDSFIIQGKSLKYVVDKGCNRSNGRKKKSRNEKTVQNGVEKRKDLRDQLQLHGICKNGPSLGSYSPLLLQPPCSSSLAQFRGRIYLMVQNQSGCRFLQRIFDEGTPQDVQIIFNEIVNHVVELMVNPFGNYFMQKLLGVCSEEQRLQIVLMVTQVPGDLVRISLNTHGTRVVQKLIETLKTRQQILLVTLSLKPGFLDLIKDLNGNRVIQRCLQCLSTEDNKFIFDGAAKFCVHIATHQHGCCVLNRCITQAVGKYREKLVAEIVAHGFHLAQDAFGNYVVQSIIELKIPSAIASLISQFEGHFVYLSMQKFGSHVVEQCLKCCEKSRPRIIHELLSVPHFEQLLQDPFANYVIQSALEVSKGTLHALLVEAVRPHTILRASPYCKKIFSRNLLKK
ncbi:pumilio 7 [Actinidia rufa]|uniref:Pumilio 7 n=1 Tax=Actinidia rufa TaxID=165716 RepID=A0A7J0E163_9ERIC|nr:pumilio 7 [Actinidia rufa]